jgi:hypothetical protein
MKLPSQFQHGNSYGRAGQMLHRYAGAPAVGFKRATRSFRQQQRRQSTSHPRVPYRVSWPRFRPRFSQFTSSVLQPLEFGPFKVLRIEMSLLIPVRWQLGLVIHCVIVHELGHLISSRHDKHPVDILSAQIPTWRQIRSELNDLPLPAWTER